MHRALTSRRLPPNRWRGLAFVLALALVAVQMLGLAHRIVHADRMQLATAATAPPGSADSSPALKSLAHRPAASWLLALFGGHDPGHDCDAFDQTSHADIVVGLTPAAAPLPGAADACFVHAAWQLGAQAQGFLARAPPHVA